MIDIVSGLVLGYLCGSIPFSWIVVRLAKGIDIRNYGSRTVSATMVGILVSKPTAVLVGCLDILKTLVPVFLGQWLISRINFVYALGIGALLGHNWSVWLNFQGGRGISVILGSLTVLFPWGAIYLLLALLLGKVFRAGAISVLFALATMPLLILIFNRPYPLLLLVVLYFLISLVKRVEANREPLPKINRRAVILRRIFLDRDIPDHHLWLHRNI